MRRCESGCGGNSNELAGSVKKQGTEGVPEQLLALWEGLFSMTLIVIQFFV